MTPVQLTQGIIRENVPDDIWLNADLSEWRLLGGTNKGQAGEQFIRQYLSWRNHIRVGNQNRVSLYDLTVGERGVPIEVKAAGMGKSGTFQFNHARIDKPYNWLVVIGVCPSEILFGAWTKQEIAAGLEGRGYGRGTIRNQEDHQKKKRPEAH